MDWLIIISHFLLWVLVVLLTVGFLILARQMGMIHRRFGTTSARMESAGPQIGEEMPEVATIDIHGREFGFSISGSRMSLLAFISASCSSCDDLAPALRSVWKNERDKVAVLLVSMGGDEKMNEDFVRRHKLDDVPYAVSKDIASLFKIITPPYCLVIDDKRILRAKGRANHLEHIESLINAAEIGHASLESFKQSQKSADGVSVMTGLSS